MNDPKTWWAPVWTGLVMDRHGTHYRRMKSAVWLWLYCVLNANRKTGVLIRKIGTISIDVGLSRNTVLRWLAVLRKVGYIETRNTGRYLVIHVQKWKTFPGERRMPSLMLEDSDFRSGRNPTSQTRSEAGKHHLQSYKSALITILNDRSITKDILKNDIDNRNASWENKGLKANETLLALDLAEALNDLHALPFYRSLTRRVPEAVLRRVLGEVKEVPREKIKSSRGALFNYLIRKHVERHANPPVPTDSQETA